MALLFTWPRKPFDLIALILMFSLPFAAAIRSDRACITGLFPHALQVMERGFQHVLHSSPGVWHQPSRACAITSNCLIRSKREGVHAAQCHHGPAAQPLLSHGCSCAMTCPLLPVRDRGMDSCCSPGDLPLLVAALRAHGRRAQPGSGHIGWF